MARAAGAPNLSQSQASSAAESSAVESRAADQRVILQLASALSEITRTFERCGSWIWSDTFRPDQTPMAFVHDEPGRGTLCWTYNMTRPGAVLDRVSMVDGRELLAYDGGGIQRVDIGFDIGRELDGQACVLFDLDGDTPPVAEHEFRRFVIHETFHFFQLFIERWKTPVGFDPFSPVEPLAIDEVLGDLEVELLESAVDADESEFMLLVRRFCQTRSHRHSSQRRGLQMSQERGLEQIEGTARFVENRYAEANGLAGRLALPPEAADSRSDWHSAGRFYRTGARIGEILDRLEVDWRPRLALGHPPAQILCDVQRVMDVADDNDTIDLRDSTTGRRH